MIDNQQQMPKRSHKFLIKLVLFITTIVVVAVIGFKVFVSMKTAEFFQNMPEKASPVTVVKVETRQWTPVLSATGTIRPNQGAMLSSQASGTVTAILVTAGQKVKKGDLLIELDSAVEKANLATYQVQLPSTKANFDRFSQLLSSKTISKSDYDKAESAYKTLLANIEAARANLARRQIYAPFDGTVGIVQVNVGEYVNVGREIVRVEDISKSKVDFSLGQNNLKQLFVGQQVEVTVDAYASEVFTATISAIEPAVNANSGLVALQATVDNSQEKLLSGMFARLNIKLAAEQNQIVVPQVAVTYNMYGETVYRLTPLSDEDKVKLQQRNDLDKVYRAHLVTVNTLDRQGIYAHLKSDSLQHGDLIVTGGQQRLSNGGLVVISDQKAVGTEKPTNDSKL